MCSKCEVPLGSKDDSLNRLGLHKWSVLVRRAADTAWEQNNLENFICAQLLELMDSQGVKKFVTFHGKLGDATDGLLVRSSNLKSDRHKLTQA